jgi:hypothetical protein
LNVAALHLWVQAQQAFEIAASENLLLTVDRRLKDLKRAQFAERG